MSVSLGASIEADLSSSGLSLLDHLGFRRKDHLFDNGTRAVLIRGEMDICVSGAMETKDVVLKTLDDRFSFRRSPEKNEKLSQYFLREASIWRHTSNHPNILELFGYVTLPGATFPSLVSPFYPEGDLRSFVENPKNSTLSSKHRLELTRDIAYGVDFLHNLTPSVVHRDIRAANVLVRNMGGKLTAVLIDFGSAKLSDPELFRILKSSRIDAAIAWSPPEYILHPECYTAPTTYGDIWSLACTCLEIFTARNPVFYTRCINEALRAGSSPLRPAGGVCDIDDPTWCLLEKCWNVTPELRPSAKEFITALDEILQTL